MNFCNIHHPVIQELVNRLDSTDDSEFVKKAFDYVRDEIPYEWQLNWSLPVEATLERGKGNCFTKSCLLWTLIKARGTGIPVEFVVANIPVAGFVNRMAPDWVWKHFPSQQSAHSAVQVHLNGKWIILDPAVDTKLARGMAQFGNSKPLFDFDGVNHAINPDLATMKIRRFNDIDFILAKKPSYKSGLVALVEGSSYFLRNMILTPDGKPIFGCPEELQHSLEAYLLVQCPDITRPYATLPPSFPGTVTKFCDPWHPKVQELVTKLRRKSKSEVDFIRLAFEWVRDRIPYVLQSDWNVPVEHTLTILQGMCSTKSCVLTSMLRAGGFQAGFYIKEQNACDAFVAPKWIRDCYSPRSVHILSAVCLNGKWIKLDTYIDKLLGSSFDKANLVYEVGFSNVAVFDGMNHAIPYADCPMQFCDNIDTYMRKRSRIPQAVLQCHNICLEFVRKMGPIFKSREEVVQAMDQHLNRFYPEIVLEAKTAAASMQRNLAGKNQRHNAFPEMAVWASTAATRSKL